ncbi:succinate dehydrogenase, cytochrome b556 subunit [Ehrlichia ruminantium]|uniref:succinate dehydrogenase, cytochrome b556 subunit n=1 Tax=Ehrlichia ruminantium TaxID=779 RepID=UPI000994B099|nr:succinate dehydrogenase, cytochrome b556 subunit [Ehrlichia ruminantium]
MSKVRPLSPHLQVYKLPMAAVLSITHRFTGILLFIGLLLLAWTFIACAIYPELIHKAYLFFSASYFALYGFKLFIFVCLNVLCYHYLNGLRHILWDFGIGLTKSAVKTSGIVVLVLSLLFSFIVYNVFLNLW